MFCGLAATLIWGAFPVMTRFGIQQSSLDFYDITFLRFATAGLILLPYLLVKGMQNIGLGQAKFIVKNGCSPRIPPITPSKYWVYAMRNDCKISLKKIYCQKNIISPIIRVIYNNCYIFFNAL